MSNLYLHCSIELLDRAGELAFALCTGFCVIYQTLCKDMETNVKRRTNEFEMMKKKRRNSQIINGERNCECTMHIYVNFVYLVSFSCCVLCWGALLFEWPKCEWQNCTYVECNEVCTCGSKSNSHLVTYFDAVECMWSSFAAINCTMHDVRCQSVYCILGCRYGCGACVCDNDNDTNVVRMSSFTTSFIVRFCCRAFSWLQQ